MNSWQGTDAFSQCTQCCGSQECQKNIQIFRLVQHGLDKLSFYSERRLHNGVFGAS